MNDPYADPRVEHLTRMANTLMGIPNPVNEEDLRREKQRTAAAVRVNRSAMAEIARLRALVAKQQDDFRQSRGH